jgi:cytochrome c-type biogenesis protein CcmH
VKWIWALLTAAALNIGATAALGGPGLDPVEALPNSVNESRARALFKELRCVVCQSESLDDSEADLAKDMRRLVRAQIASGRSDDEIRSYLTGRYGEFVLLKPPARPATWALWFGPFVLFLAVSGWVVWFLYRSKRSDEKPLSAEEQLALDDHHRNLRNS